jgi:hypothetical protein
MNTPEFCRIQLRLHRTQSLSNHRPRFTRVEMYVFVVGFDPIDLLRGQEGDSTACFDDKTLKVLRLVFNIFKQRAYLLRPLF